MQAVNLIDKCGVIRYINVKKTRHDGHGCFSRNFRLRLVTRFITFVVSDQYLIRCDECGDFMKTIITQNVASDYVRHFCSINIYVTILFDIVLYLVFSVMDKPEFSIEFRILRYAAMILRRSLIRTYFRLPA